MPVIRGTRFGLPQVLTVGMAAAVLGVLLWPHHVDGVIGALAGSAAFGSAAPGSPTWWALEDLGNIALFAPLGFALAWWTRRPVVALLAGVMISLLCEFAQQWIPTRHPSLLDALLNALGMVVGIALAVAVGRSRAGARPVSG